MAHEATLSFEYDSSTAAALVYRSIEPEVGDIDGNRSRARLSRTAETVTVRIEATDCIGLRAGVNTWSALVAVAEQTGRVMER